MAPSRVMLAVSLCVIMACTVVSHSPPQYHRYLKPQYFMLIMNQDIAALETAPAITNIVHRSAVLHTRLSTTYRRIRAPPQYSHMIGMEEHISMEDIGTSNDGHYYCRIPVDISSREYWDLLQRDVLLNDALLDRTAVAIHDTLASLDCFLGQGDAIDRATPLLYRFCPQGTLHRIHNNSVHKMEEEIVEEIRSSEKHTHLGTYDPSADPQWNTDIGQWEVPLLPGGPCSLNEGDVYRTRLSFHCRPTNDINAKLLWLVKPLLRCEYEIEIGSAAVCEWHRALDNVIKCPIPCIPIPV